MEHLLAKATTVDQEAGTFTAIASAWDADREDDEIARDAFDETINAWQGSGKTLPLLWEHGSEAVGFVDPDEMYVGDRGLIIGGEVDRETDRGKLAWKMIKVRSAGFSIGFGSESRPRKGGGRVLTSVDLLEISVTSRPMHPSTRALSWKSATSTETLSEGDLRARSRRAAQEALADVRRKPVRERPAESVDELVERSRREYYAAREKEAEEARAAERERDRKAAVDQDLRRVLMMRGEQARDPDEQSPGLGRNWQPLPSPAAIRRAEAEERKLRERYEQRRRERKAELERLEEIERQRGEPAPPAMYRKQQ